MDIPSSHTAHIQTEPPLQLSISPEEMSQISGHFFDLFVQPLLLVTLQLFLQHRPGGDLSGPIRHRDGRVQDAVVLGLKRLVEEQ